MFSLFSLQILLVISQSITVNSGKESSNSCCHTPPEVPSAKEPVLEKCNNSTFRYDCMDGYVRKAGTSNLIKCQLTNPPPRWTRASLICIPDPTIPLLTTTTESDTSTVTITSRIGNKSAIKHEEGEPLAPSIPTMSSNSHPVVGTGSYSNGSTPEPASETIGPGGLIVVVGSLVFILTLVMGYVCFRKRGCWRTGSLFTREEVIPMKLSEASNTIVTHSPPPEGS